MGPHSETKKVQYSHSFTFQQISQRYCSIMQAVNVSNHTKLKATANRCKAYHMYMVLGYAVTEIKSSNYLVNRLIIA